MKKRHITLVGKQPLPVYYLLRQYGADVVYFICSSDTEAIAMNLIKTLPSNIEKHIEIVHPYNILQLKVYCEKLHKKYAEDEFSYNLTGGTKVMSFAAFDVAKCYSAAAHFVTQENTSIDITTGDEFPLSMELDNMEILSLSGHELKSYEKASYITAERLEMAREVGEFINSDSRAYERLIKYLKPYIKAGDMRSLPTNYTLLDGSKYIRQRDKITITDKEGDIIFEQEGEYLYELLFQGRWWEVLVTSWMRKLFMSDERETWCSVTFKDETSLNDKVVRNETDILINNKMQLTFVECKSGKVTQDDIYKLEKVSETYGGDKSRAILVSFHSLQNKVLRKKCDEGDILLIDFNGKLRDGFTDKQKGVIAEYLSQPIT